MQKSPRHNSLAKVTAKLLSECKKTSEGHERLFVDLIEMVLNFKEDPYKGTFQLPKPYIKCKIYRKIRDDFFQLSIFLSHKLCKA